MAFQKRCFPEAPPEDPSGPSLRMVDSPPQRPIDSHSVVSSHSGLDTARRDPRSPGHRFKIAHRPTAKGRVIRLQTRIDGLYFKSHVVESVTRQLTFDKHLSHLSKE